MLCSSGLDLSAVDSRGYTCAHLAAAHGKCSALQAIFKAGEDVKTVDQRGWTVLHHAAYHGRLGIVQVYLYLVSYLDSSLGTRLTCTIIIMLTMQLKYDR